MPKNGRELLFPHDQVGIAHRMTQRIFSHKSVFSHMIFPGIGNNKGGHFSWIVDFSIFPTRLARYHWFIVEKPTENWKIRKKLWPELFWNTYVQVILFGINCAIFYTNLNDLFCQFISWTNWINSGKFMDNSWISCQVMHGWYGTIGTFFWRSHNY